MKATCLLFLMIVCAELTPGTSYAAQSNPASQQPSSKSPANTVSDHPRDAVHDAPIKDGKNQKDGTLPDEQRDLRHASEKNQPRGRVSLTKSNRPTQVPNNPEPSTLGKVIDFHRPGSDKSGASARGGSIQHKTVNIALPVRPASVIRSTVSPLNNVRHRGPNPAIVGGLGNSNTRNTGSISGTHLLRRP